VTAPGPATHPQLPPLVPQALAAARSIAGTHARLEALILCVYGGADARALLWRIARRTDGSREQQQCAAGQVHQQARMHGEVLRALDEAAVSSVDAGGTSVLNVRWRAEMPQPVRREPR
jgi:hypothetical protein